MANNVYGIYLLKSSVNNDWLSTNSRHGLVHQWMRFNKVECLIRQQLTVI